LGKKDEPAYLTFDGEKVQLACYSEEEIQTTFHQENIHVGKLSASTTEIEQPCDRGTIFKLAKKGLKSITDSNIDTNHPLNNSLLNVITEHESKKSEGNRMTYPHKKMLRMGLLRIQKVLQLTLRQDIVQESFSKTGMYPFNLDKILDECKSKLNDEQRDIIKDKLPGLVDIFELEGHISDASLIKSGILPTVNSAKPKDQLTLSSQRAVLLSHAKSVALLKDASIKAAEKKEKGKKLPAEVPIPKIVATKRKEDITTDACQRVSQRKKQKTEKMKRFEEDFDDEELINDE
jgi:hypothetical protein